MKKLLLLLFAIGAAEGLAKCIRDRASTIGTVRLTGAPSPTCLNRTLIENVPGRHAAQTLALTPVLGIELDKIGVLGR